MKCLKIDQLKWQKCWTAKKALGFILIWKNIPFPAIPAVNSHSEATEALPPVSSSLQTFLTLHEVQTQVKDLIRFDKCRTWLDVLYLHVVLAVSSLNHLGKPYLPNWTIVFLMELFHVQYMVLLLLTIEKCVCCGEYICLACQSV